MKNILKKSVVILVITTLLVSFNMINISNATQNSENMDDKLSYQLKNFDIDLKSSIKRSTYNELLSESTNLGSSYDMSEKYDIIVKNQQQTGCCWAFAYSSMIETSLKDNKEYSPMHIDYSMSKLYNKTPGLGGNFPMALSYAASESGPVYEEDFSFESVYDETNNEEDKFFLADLDTVNLDKYTARARIEDVKYFPSIIKKYSGNTLTYTSSAGVNYTEKEVTAVRNLVKQHIKNEGAVIASFYTDFARMYIDENGNGVRDPEETKEVIASKKNYYDLQNNSFFIKSGEVPNHAVTIIGWDDNFSKDNFKLQENKPQHNGAYIAINSYGEEFGKNGMFYISYDDCIIEQQMLGIEKITKTNNDSKEVKYKYEYDEIGANDAIMAKQTEIVYGANVFTKKDSKHIETLNEIGIHLLTAEGIEIYVNPNNSDLSKCELVASYTGENALEAGYHILKLASPVQLTGNQFVVKIKYINKESPNVPIEYNFKSNNVIGATDEIKEMYKNAKSSAGESFVSIDGNKWSDLNTLKVNLNTYKDSSICIKAFTTQGDEKVAVTGITLNKSSLSMQVGDNANLVATIKPTNAFNKNVKWTSSDSKVATISDKGIINAKSKGTTTITVTTDDGKFTANCKVTVTEKKSSEDDIYKNNKDDENNQNKNDKKDEKDDKNTNKKEENKNNNKSDKKNSSEPDSSQSKKPLPQTGVTSIIGIIMVSGIIVFIIYRKNKKYKGIK